MTGVILKTENLAIPILGLCIVLFLGIAAYLEPQKDYSRRTYIQMLVSCAAILAAECVQVMPAHSPAAMKATMFVFYAALAAICYLWTLYAYYWVSGRQPAKNAMLLFSAGPLIELILLIVNIFTGIFYSVNPDGVYARGGLFAAYIGFSYFYLICAIVATVFSRAGKNKKAGKEDQALFMLCFLFPILGPCVQYVLPAMPLMGITEAIALLIVYVSIQQRAAAGYAVERARSEDEYRAYEDSLEQLLTESAEALFVLRMNLTQNVQTGGRGAVETVLKQNGSKTVDELRGIFASMIRRPEEKAHFLEMSDRNRLIEQYKAGTKQMSITYHRKMESGETHLIKLFLHMLQNPASGDIESVMYSVDIDRQDKEEKVISAITKREYSYIALIDVETGKIHYQYADDSSDNSANFMLGDYDTVINQVIPDIQSREQMEDGRASLQTVADELRHQDEYSFVVNCQTPEGDMRQTKLSYQYLDAGKTEILFFSSDITEEMRQEREHAETLQKALDEVRHADAMKSEFLSNVSHDMRTPLNAILGYTNLAESAGSLSEKDGYIEKIGSAGNIMLDLINDTLDLSKISSGEIILKPEPHIYDEVFQKVVSSIGPLADEKHIKFTVDDSRAAKVPVLVDALRFKEIVINLLSNAVKFTPENGQVSLKIECERLDEHIVHDKFTVSDTGCGMKPEFLAKMYEPFAQERQSANTVGSGLGLSIVKKLVDLMNGTISVKSEPGKGTEFTVRLDFERAEVLTGAAENSKQAWDALRGLHVLLAEDNAMNTEIAKAVLESKGLEVTCAENGRTACRLFAESEPNFFDVILMDIRMPEMNGLDAAVTIRQMGRTDAGSIPIIAMSADAFEEDIQKCLKAGMNGHVAKPIDSEGLFKVLSKAISQASQQTFTAR
jgi:signal transduction histidine kinase/CheY-like chemotaxis protein